MLVAVYQLELFLPDSGSLKEKRYVLQSLKTKIRTKFNYSIAEVGEHDKWQRSIIGLSMVATERKLFDQTFEKVIQLVENDGRVIITQTICDIY